MSQENVELGARMMDAFDRRVASAITGLTITGGVCGISNAGQLSLTHATVTANSGVGISNFGLEIENLHAELTLDRSIVSGNGGDGIDSGAESRVYGNRSTVSENNYVGISSVFGTQVTLTNSTIDRNGGVWW
jgi:hypothetical protein